MRRNATSRNPAHPSKKRPAPSRPRVSTSSLNPAHFVNLVLMLILSNFPSLFASLTHPLFHLSARTCSSRKSFIFEQLFHLFHIIFQEQFCASAAWRLCVNAFSPLRSSLRA